MAASAMAMLSRANRRAFSGMALPADALTYRGVKNGQGARGDRRRCFGCSDGIQSGIIPVGDDIGVRDRFGEKHRQ